MPDEPPSDSELADELRRLSRTMHGAQYDDVVTILRTAADRIVWLSAYVAVSRRVYGKSADE